MKLHIKKRHMVRIVSFALAFVLIFVGTVIYNQVRFVSLKRQIAHRYQSAMEELSSEMENISVTLSKALYTGTASTLTSLTNELVLQAGTAASALAELPIKHESLETVSKFLSQVSDYSLVLARNVVRGGSISNEERKNLITLSEIAKKLSKSLDEAKTMYNSAEDWADNIENALKGSDKIGEIDNSITEAEESLSDYPTLIYDGPFSDHILDKESLLLKNSKEISRDEGREIAAAAVGITTDKLSDNPDEEGKIPAFVFGFENGVVAVTKQGGYVCYFRKTRDIESAEPDYEKAVSLAKKYVDSLNMGNFKTSYYFADEGMCVINFAYIQGDTICYPDLIKVGVAMDTGEIVFYEAAGYIMNHKARTLKVPENTAEKAANVISDHLKVKQIGLAVIPSGGENELYCYELLCLGEDNEEILVYVNTETLFEEQILILLKTDGGVLTK